MEKQQHTPGPWAYIVPDGHVVRHPQIYSDFGPVANATWLGENKLDQLKANARLIAAAPDLLKAHEPERGGADFLDWIADRLVHIYGESENIDFVICLRRRAAKARLAIAKATGG